MSIINDTQGPRKRGGRRPIHHKDTTDQSSSWPIPQRWPSHSLDYRGGLMLIAQGSQINLPAFSYCNPAQGYMAVKKCVVIVNKVLLHNKYRHWRRWNLSVVFQFLMIFSNKFEHNCITEWIWNILFVLANVPITTTTGTSK